MNNFYFNKGKRLFDYVLSLLAIYFLSPFFVIAAVAIFLEDGFPVIFKQKRIGQGGKEFVIYKFRSMAKNVGDIPSALAKNVSITKVGRILRRLNIDELPQLVNIIKGDMSIVGPRASLKNQVYLNKLREEMGIFNIKPGLTGLAQVNSYAGMPEDEKAYWDKIYTQNITLIEDLKIIFRTFSYLLKPPPVY